ncbi:uncharacterized protein K452DRAFT_282509 [Aplosporella prunicola CBS 121167]|uniref:CBF1-interacting co-repressor CIR N-terminal domain-containing protein n=1 Tax=Aplosporella prunicola CBS 121167 TaxID=1176127 RepID=A0A6A6BU19_9PEZI|nr:uncharacterized protein K452DRAFT_282509 [Aplosporella prunicola CBS 121167]KAF2147500.1 hypothetical protein K452DRAFT_282509 [Aplosporella prunicola CBS 121167]
MPLHLLGKKSWNVYNPANIERVRRDEAAAQARDEERDRRLDDYDAACRAATLRGLPPPSPPPDLEEPSTEKPPKNDGGSRIKRRKLAGEDDTDRDIRVAREMEERNRAAKEQLITYGDQKKTATDMPLIDHAGHINLFPVDPKAAKKAEKNSEHEAEKARKERELEDQYTMRFSNAAGRDGQGKPWYTNKARLSHHSGTEVLDEEVEEPGKNVWGREDPGRKDRDKARMSTTDPLAFMKRAQIQLKDAEKDRKLFAAEREKDILDLIADEKEKARSEGRRRKSRREHADDYDHVDEDRRPREHRSSRHHHRSRSRDRHRHKSHRDRSRSPRGERHKSHRSRSRSREKDRHRSRRDRSRSADGERHSSHRNSHHNSHRSSRHRESESHYESGRWSEGMDR